MNAEARFVLAVILMLIVLVGGNILFAPPPVPVDATADSTVGVTAGPAGGADPGRSTAEPSIPGPPPVAFPGQAPTGDLPAGPLGPPTLAPAPEVREIVVQGPIYRLTFSNIGARVTSVSLPGHASFTREGPVELVDPEAPGLLGVRVVVDGDTADLRNAPMEVSPEGGLDFQNALEPRTLTFRYRPGESLVYEVEYTFDPTSYLVEVRGSVPGVSRGVLIADLGYGIALNEVDEGIELRSMAFATNHLQRGVNSVSLSDVSEPRVEDGPFLWAATNSRYFVIAMLPGLGSGGEKYLGGITARPLTVRESAAEITVSQSIESGGAFDFRFYAGPQDYQALTAIGNDLEEVNAPGGWFRGILRPIVAAIMWVLVFFHQNLSIGYGWVLILMGILMRIVTFPLNHKAMRAQMKNMRVQPLLKEIQEKYKVRPEMSPEQKLAVQQKMQKEFMKLYKDHGFNPLAGCWPLLLPWPILIALFFVFQNTIELRGVPFWWLPDLSAKDPIFVLPVLLGVSMFVMQWITMRSMDTSSNPQMKVLLWGMPIMMVVLMVNFPAGLNLYYLTGNLAALPQTWWIANERQKIQRTGPTAPARA